MAISSSTADRGSVGEVVVVVVVVWVGGGLEVGVEGWFICSIRIWVRCAERKRRSVESTRGAVLIWVVYGIGFVDDNGVNEYLLRMLGRDEWKAVVSSLQRYTAIIISRPKSVILFILHITLSLFMSCY